MPLTTLRSRLLEYGLAARDKPGERVSGDLSTVREDAEGVLIAVVDGLGHGPEAARASAVAVAALGSWQGQPVSRLMEQCHEALAGTRGAVIALAALDARQQTLSWLCVGNVEGRLIRRAGDGGRETRSLLMQSGIGGHRLPKLHPTTVTIQAGDIIAIATDGIRSEFETEIRPELSPQQAADRVLARCAKATDDALILVGCWIGIDAAH